MFDCVYPTRTARFGVALVPTGIFKWSLFSILDQQCHVVLRLLCSSMHSDKLYNDLGPTTTTQSHMSKVNSS